MGIIWGLQLLLSIFFAVKIWKATLAGMRCYGFFIGSTIICVVILTLSQLKKNNKIAIERDKLLEKLTIIRNTVKFQRKEIVTVAAQLEAIAVGEITTIPEDLEIRVLRPGEDNGSIALRQATKESEKLEKQLAAWKSEWSELYKQEKDLQEYLLAPG